MNTAEKPTFENKMQVKCVFSQPANHSKTLKWRPGVKTLKAFVIWLYYCTEIPTICTIKIFFI